MQRLGNPKYYHEVTMRTHRSTTDHHAEVFPTQPEAKVAGSSVTKNDRYLATLFSPVNVKMTGP